MTLNDEHTEYRLALAWVWRIRSAQEISVLAVVCLLRPFMEVRRSHWENGLTGYIATVCSYDDVDHKIGGGK